MLVRRICVALIVLSSSVALVSCGATYDEASGLYNGDGFFLQFPAGWHEIASPPNVEITVAPPGESAQINLVVQELPPAVTFYDYLNQLVSRWGRIGAREIESGEIMMGGVAGHWSMRTLTIGGQRLIVSAYSVISGPTAYSIICIATEEDLGTYQEVFDGVAQSLIFSG